jgi:hypothetical protein
VFLAVAYGIRKVGLIGSLLEIQLREGGRLGFKACDATELSVQKGLVGGRTLNWIGADVHDM